MPSYVNGAIWSFKEHHGIIIFFFMVHFYENTSRLKFSKKATAMFLGLGSKKVFLEKCKSTEFQHHAKF